MEEEVIFVIVSPWSEEQWVRQGIHCVVALYPFCVAGGSAGVATGSVSFCITGNVGTGNNTVPAYLCSMFSVLHCKEITMVLVENILHFAFALGCSVIMNVAVQAIQPCDVQWQSSNVTSKFYFFSVACKRKLIMAPSNEHLI